MKQKIHNKPFFLANLANRLMSFVLAAGAVIFFLILPEPPPQIINGLVPLYDVHEN